MCATSAKHKVLSGGGSSTKRETRKGPTRISRKWTNDIIATGFRDLEQDGNICLFARRKSLTVRRPSSVTHIRAVASLVRVLDAVLSYGSCVYIYISLLALSVVRETENVENVPKNKTYTRAHGLQTRRTSKINKTTI